MVSDVVAKYNCMACGFKHSERRGKGRRWCEGVCCGRWGGLLLAHRRHKGGDGQEDDGHATHHVLHEASRHEVRVPNVVVNLETELKGPEAGSV